jgi:hypothetical protein
VNVVPNPRPINSGVLAFGCQLATTFLLECARRLAVDRKNRSVFSPGQPETADTEKQTLDEMTADFTNRPAWDFPKMQRFGHRPLTPAFLLWELVEGIKEPMTNIWACGFLFLVACMLTPLVPENKPPFDEQNGEFVYEPATFNGLLWWAFKIILLGIIPTVAFVGMAYCLPDSFEPDDEKIMKDGMDPDAIILTTPEMGRRTTNPTL